jgi:hypothetical protein
MSKHSRSGGKFTGNHTTLIPAATVVCDIANACLFVTKITPGFIKAGLKSVNGQRRVKITDKEGAILLSVRDNTSQQEVFVYSSNMQVAKLAIARGVRNAGMHLSFGGE